MDLRNPHHGQAGSAEQLKGTVYLALRVDRNGHVTDIVAEQVNLGVTGPDDILNRYREMLAKAALQAVSQWTYEPPTTGKLAMQDSWTVYVPITYDLQPLNAPKSNTVWQTYVPGPYTPASWIDKPDADTVDALADDAVRTDGAGPTLIPAAYGHG